MLRARRSATASGSSGRFFETGPVDHADIGVGRIELPIRYYRTDCFLGVFSADVDAVAARLPSDRLAPVRLTAGRAAVGIVAYNYLETGVGPYGEIGVAAMCTFGGHAPPVLPALLETRYPGFGAFVLHLPVTTRVACAAGRTVWGYPKFVSDMAFDLQPELQRVELREGGADLLSLEVQRGGRVVRDHKPLVTFTVKDGDLIRTEVASRAVYQVGVGRSRGHLELGDHPLAGELRGLDLSGDAVATKSYLAHAAILPAGRVLTRADRPYDGFAGSDLEHGRHTIRYDSGVERVVTERAPALVAE
ncbi:MAG: acetoacetate decarboxylase family protein [Acidimicrobiia bacterium]